MHGLQHRNPQAPSFYLVQDSMWRCWPWPGWDKDWPGDQLSGQLPRDRDARGCGVHRATDDRWVPPSNEGDPHRPRAEGHPERGMRWRWWGMLGKTRTSCRQRRSFSRRGTMSPRRWGPRRRSFSRRWGARRVQWHRLEQPVGCP